MRNNKYVLVAIIVVVLGGAMVTGAYVLWGNKPVPVGTRVIDGKEYPLYENKNSDSKVFRYEPIPIK